MVVLDSTTILLFIQPDASAPLDPNTDLPVHRANERIEYLIQRLDEAGTTVIIPTPVLSEILVHSGDAAAEYLNILNQHAVFRIVPFDQRAAIEVAAMTREAIAAGDKKSGIKGSWHEIKFDRQIAAIARVEDASAIYTDDKNLINIAGQLGIDVVQMHELPLPPENPQMALDLPSNAETEEDDGREG